MLFNLLGVAWTELLLLYLPCTQVDTEAVRKLKPVDAAAVSKQKKLSEMDIEAVVKNDSTYLKVC